MRLLILLLVPALAMAQVTPRNLLVKNFPEATLPAVLLSQSSYRPFPRTPAEWKRQLPDSVLRQIVHNGEEALQGNFPGVPASVTLDFVRSGGRLRYENITFGKRNRLWTLVLAESVEGKGRFTDAIADGIWSISEESFWGASAHLFIQKAGRGLPDVENPVVDLFAAETAANLALADYFVGPQLDSISPLIRKRIYYEVKRRIFIPLRSARYEWMGGGRTDAKLNNWAPWIMSNYLTAVLLLEKHPAERIRYVSQAMRITDQYINGLGEDGGCEEGPLYWTFGAGSVLDILNLLGSASRGRIDIYRKPIIQSMAAYIYKAHISGDYYVNIADAHPEMLPEPLMTWRFGQAVEDTVLRSFGAWLYRKNEHFSVLNGQMFHRVRELFDLAGTGAIAADSVPFHDIGSAWLPRLQLMVSRPGNGLFVAAHGGANTGSHHHNDLGDCIVYANGYPVIIDVGSGTYTAKTFSKDRYTLWFNTSPYHNLPTINGTQQEEGERYIATEVSYHKDPEGMKLAMNLEKAYPAEARLTSWRRTITAGSREVLIADSFRAALPLHSLTQSFMTVCSTDIHLPGTIVFTTSHGTPVFLRYDADAWQASQEVIPLTTAEEEGLKTSWHQSSVTRILLTARSPAATGNFQYRIGLTGP